MISLFLSAPTLSFAEEPACAGIYREQHSTYFTKIEELKSMRSTLTRGSSVAAAALGVCLWKTRSIIGCGALFGVAIVGSQGYRYKITNDIQKLEDAHDVYEIYGDIVRENYGSENVQGLFRALGSSELQERPVTRALVRMMDSGELSKSGAPSNSLEEILALLKKYQGQL